MAVRLAIGVLLASQLVAGRALAASPLSLRAAVDFAIEHSPTLDAARRQDLTDELTAKNAFAAFLPSLDFVSNHGVQGSLNAPGFVPVLSSLAATGSGPWVSTVGVSISENLYDNGATITAYRIASAQLEASHLAFMKARENLCLSVASEFYNYSLSTGLLDVRRQRKQILDKQFRLIENSYRQGVKTEQDYLRFKTQVQRAELDLMSAETTLRDSAVELTRLLGGPADGAPPEFAPLAVEATVPAFPEKAPPLSEIFDARIAEAGRKINELNEDLVKRRYWPQVNLAANSGYSFNNYIGSSAAIPPYSAFTYTALLTVTYNLWDFGVRRNNVKIADQQRNIGDDNLSAAVINDQADIERLMQQLSLEQHQYSLTKELLTLSQKTYVLLEEQYRLGKITYLDLITGLNDLLDAKTGFLSTHFSSLQSVAHYRFYEGTLYEAIEK